MNILLIGASGLLGKNLYKVLADSGHNVIGTYREQITQGLCWVDISDLHSCENLLREKKFDIIIHSAAVRDPEICEKNKALAFDVNVKGTENVLNKIIGNPAYIYISTNYTCFYFPATNRSYVLILRQKTSVLQIRSILLLCRYPGNDEVGHQVWKCPKRLYL